MRCVRSAICSALALTASVLVGCGVARPQDFGEPHCPDFAQAIQPLLEQRCGQCHGASTAAGAYRVDGYLEAVSRTEDGSPRVLAQADGSMLLKAARGELPSHEAIPEEELTKLSDWNLRCRASPAQPIFHELGWSTPTDEHFHGRELRAAGYSVVGCQKCHGEDLKGGGSGVSCESCHTKGVFSCNTCHGDSGSPAPPKDLEGASSSLRIGVGAHRAHLNDGPLHRAFDCSVCHITPVKADDDGHYRRGEEIDVAEAEVTLRSAEAVTAQWDRSAATCTNAYCHAPNPMDTSGTAKTPVWNAVSGQPFACNTCHGSPPSTHSYDNCELCHGPGYSQTTVNVDRHVNGTVDFSSLTGCSSCHSGPRETPFVDLSGGSDVTQLPVGVHDKHINAKDLRGPIDCIECHPVPASIFSQGHMDNTRPADLFSGPGISTADNAKPVWDRAAGTCTNTYCHGGGEGLLLDTYAGVIRTLSWTDQTLNIACLDCHAFPPRDNQPHHMAPNVGPCVNCHNLSMDGWQFRSTIDPVTGVKVTKHLNGVIDLNAPDAGG